LKSNTISKRRFLSVAEGIGDQLCNQAFWLDSQCNWIGRSAEDIDANGSLLLSNHSLGPDLYEGTSGIGLFLSYLYKYTHNERYYKVASGAISHALRHVKDIPDVSRFGFYNGRIGIAYAATQIGILNNDYTLCQSALVVLKDLIVDRRSDRHFMDVITGNAGAIPSLLSMYEVFRDEDLFEFALFLGEELLLSAVKEPANGLSWSSEIKGLERTRHNLTGFSHGAAGIGYGLLELFRKSGDKRFMKAADQAFNYEDSWYSDQNNNWPDFRTDSGNRKKDTQDNLDYAITWCHGAPGIGLSRLRAYQILKDKKYLKDYMLAQKIIFKTIKDRITCNVMNNYCLCHGLFGICEPLVLDGATHFSDKKCLQLVKKIAFEAIDRHHSNGQNPWPCGIQTGQTPGLMLGLAGIGYFCLRLYDIKKIPSILIIIPP
jgi:type 2 lantibiotic biosynthesis protein LanM